MIGVKILGLLLLEGALLAAILSTALPTWLQLPLEEEEEGASSAVYYGLFQQCRWDCTTWRVFEDGFEEHWLRASQAMMILACVAMAISLLLGLLYAMIFKDTKAILVASAITAIAGAGSCAIGIIVFVVKMKEVTQSDWKYHASFGIAVASAVISATVGVLFLLICKRK
ncbi:hypothetical protein DPMN_097689 [Dreissena polymorpha]|uniref:Uncharacterized protein n=1 Tax=Dreissena polymorpha TaxID=45954 RepID=A0A9D4LAY9_DREPO|nr:hypothetical protein DPMN_096122 [Dreissena polymorpha]KAH3855128.1 hypothetical protein DPMN_097689 [Dreissena polymorpha]